MKTCIKITKVFKKNKSIFGLNLPVAASSHIGVNSSTNLVEINTADIDNRKAIIIYLSPPKDSKGA